MSNEKEKNLHDYDNGYLNGDADALLGTKSERIWNLTERDECYVYSQGYKAGWIDKKRS